MQNVTPDLGIAKITFSIFDLHTVPVMNLT
jgi:hypothetical protein